MRAIGLGFCHSVKPRSVLSCNLSWGLVLSTEESQVAAALVRSEKTGDQFAELHCIG
jgi:hypothetical protein